MKTAAALFCLVLGAFLLSGAETPARTVKRLITCQEQQEDLTPLLPECVKLLDSPDYDVRFAALRTLVFAGVPCPEAVPGLLKIVRKPVPEKNRRMDALTGYALSALVTICEDEKVFSKLLDSPDPKLVKSLSMALLDSPRLTPALRKKLRWPGSAYAPAPPCRLIDPSFEKDDLSAWELRTCEGAEGSISLDNTVARSGKNSLRIEKSNAAGFLELRYRGLFDIPAGEEFFWRGYYQAQVTPGSSLLVFGFEDEKGKFLTQSGSLARSARQSQSFAVNTPPGKWDQRIGLVARLKKPARLRPVIRFFGDPGVVHIDDLAFPGAAWIQRRAYAIPEICRLSPQEARKRLNERSNATGKIGFYPSGAVGLEIDGKLLPPVIYFSSIFPELGDYALFSKIGVKVCNVTLHLNDVAGPHTKGSITEISSGPVWPSAGNENYNFAPLVSRLKRLLRQESDLYIILGLNITWPQDYFKYNPDCLWADEKGRKAWGTSLHLRGFFEKAPAPDCIPWPSPYADKPFEDAAKVMAALIRELKKEGLHKPVVGCFVAGGHDGQFEIRYRDYSPAGTEAWRKWLKERYGNDDALRRAWKRKGVSLASAAVPPEHFGKYKSGASPIFFAPGREAPDIDYETFRQERIWRVKEIMLAAVKKELGKTVLGVAWQMEKFLVKDPSRFLASDVFDIIVTQPVYQQRRAGMPFGNLAPMDSFRRAGKLWISELDIRSFLRSVYADELKQLKVGIPFDMEQFRQTVRKLTAEQIASGGGGWWYLDMFGGCHAHPEMLDEIRRGVELYDRIHRRKDARNRAEAAVVISRSAILNQRQWAVSFPMMYQIFALHQSGVPLDVRFAEDLFSSPDGDKYKIYFFANQFELSEKERDFIDTRLKRGNRTLIFNYASGVVDKTRGILDLKCTEKLTGFKLRTKRELASPAVGPRQAPGNLYRAYLDQSDSSSIGRIQRIVIADREAVILSSFLDDGTPAVGQKDFPGWRSVFAGSPNAVTAEVFHRLAKEAGVSPVMAPDAGIVMLSRRFLAVTALKNGKTAVRLPFPARVTDAFDGKVLSDGGRDFTLELRSGDVHFLLLAPEAASRDVPAEEPLPFRDGGFEGAQTTWRPLINGKLEQTALCASSGKKSARLTPAEPGKAASAYCPRFSAGSMIGRRLRLQVSVRGKGVGRIVLLPYPPGSSRTQLHRGEKVTLSPDSWRRISMLWDPGEKIFARIAPAVELASGEELFFDDFRIFDAPAPGVRLAGPAKPLVEKPGTAFGLPFSGALPGMEISACLLDKEFKPHIFRARADQTGRGKIAIPGLEAGYHEFILFGGGANALCGADIVPADEMRQLQGAAAKSKIPRGSRILILGDSLSDFQRGSNYADKLEYFLRGREVKVNNAGVRGDHILRVRDRLAGKKTYRPQAYRGIFSPVPDIAVIFLGHNDTVLREGVIQVSPEAQKAAFREVLTQLRKKKPDMRIILVTPVRCHRETCLANMEKRLKKGLGRIEFGRPELLEKYIAVLREVAGEFNCEVVDLYTPMGQMKDTTALFNPGDGVHISPRGNRFVALSLLRQL